MSKKPWDTKEFKALEKEWNKKLQKSGFMDIEPDSDRENNTFHKQVFEPNLRYTQYNNACWAFLHSGRIKDKTDHFVFERHCEGMSSRDIAKLLENTKMRKLDRSTIDRRISKILKSAGIDPVSHMFNK